MRKINIETRRNLILTALSIAFWNAADSGLAQIENGDTNGFGIPIFVFAGIGFLAVFSLLIARLWQD